MITTPDNNPLNTEISACGIKSGEISSSSVVIPFFIDPDEEDDVVDPLSLVLVLLVSVNLFFIFCFFFFVRFYFCLNLFIIFIYYSFFFFIY